MKLTGVCFRMVLSLTIFMLMLEVIPSRVSAQTTNGAILGTVLDVQLGCFDPTRSEF